MAHVERRASIRGGVKVGLLMWLLGAPVLVIIIALAAC